MTTEDVIEYVVILGSTSIGICLWKAKMEVRV